MTDIDPAEETMEHHELANSPNFRSQYAEEKYAHLMRALSENEAFDKSFRITHKIKVIALDPKQSEFFMAKGLAFRELWQGRFTHGITIHQFNQFNEMVATFHATEES